MPQYSVEYVVVSQITTVQLTVWWVAVTTDANEDGSRHCAHPCHLVQKFSLATEKNVELTENLEILTCPSVLQIWDGWSFDWSIHWSIHWLYLWFIHSFIDSLIYSLTDWLTQVNAVRDGMATIIPVPLLSLVTPQHLEQLICGMPHVSIDVLKRVVRSVLSVCDNDVIVIGNDCFGNCPSDNAVLSWFHVKHHQFLGQWSLCPWRNLTADCHSIARWEFSCAILLTWNLEWRPNLPCCRHSSVW